MKKTLIFLGLVIFSGQLARAQEDLGIIIKTYPIRYLYGPNLESTWKLPNKHLLSLMYQHHDRDWVGVRDSRDVLGLTAIPQLETTEGYTFYVSYLFPMGDTEKTHAWLGPKAGGKNILAMVDQTDIYGEEYQVRVDQSNAYLLCQLSAINKFKGFVIEGYTHAGLVNITRQDTNFEPDGSIDYVEDEVSYWLPHFLVGFSIGWGF